MQENTFIHTIKQLRITEKTTLLSGSNCYTFEVFKQASKRAIKTAVENFFPACKGKVLSVNVINQKGKRKRNRGQRKMGRTPGIKKAMVSLAPGCSINLN